MTQKLRPMDYFGAFLTGLDERGIQEIEFAPRRASEIFFGAIQKFDLDTYDFDLIKKDNPYVGKIDELMVTLYLSGQTSYVENTSTLSIHLTDDFRQLMDERVPAEHREHLCQVTEYLCNAALQ